MASVCSNDSNSSGGGECKPPNNSPSSSLEPEPDLLGMLNPRSRHHPYRHSDDPDHEDNFDTMSNPAELDNLSLDSGDDFTDAEDDLSLPAKQAMAKAEASKMLPGTSSAPLTTRCGSRWRKNLLHFGPKDPLKSIDEGGHDTTLLTSRSKVDIISTTSRAAIGHAEDFVHKVWDAGWRVAHHGSLPDWLKDNEYLMKGHRPPTNSFALCFKSIFRIHTETGNIWTHLLGFIAFIGIAVYFLTRPSVEVQWQEKAVFSAFFAGAILCLGFSWIFHTVYCHSERVGKLFNKLDYCGIALLTMGSFVPWLYYSFYCRLEPKIAYLILIFVLGISCIVVSLWDKFSQPQYRAVRAGVFIGLGLSGIIPAMHYVITDGFYHAINCASLGWLALMALLYISGAIIYAVRIPERLFPGKFDIWFQSHQIFHVFVVAAAFVHYHGITAIANYRLTLGDCLETKNS